MPRTIEVSLPPEKTGELLARIRELDNVAGLTLQRGASLNPPGDVLTIRATNDGTRRVLDIVGELGIDDGGGSILTSELHSLIARPYQNSIERESNETIWEEVGFMLRRQTNVSFNYLALMALSGAVAAAGLWTNTVHIVVGAMVIAPGFEPLLRIPFGLIGGPRALASRGLTSTVAGYVLLALGAALTLLLLRAVDPGAAAGSDLLARSWVRYWSTVTPPGVVVAFLAGMAGAVVVMAQRSVLTAGVMIALALIPAMSIAGMALAVGDPALAGRGLMRWAVDAAAVVIASAVVLGSKQALVHRRRALG